VSPHPLVFSLGARGGGQLPPLEHSTKLFLPVIDGETGVASLQYPAECVPLGVAWVVARRKDYQAEAGGAEVGSTLVLFRTRRGSRGRLIRVADVPLLDLGLAQCEALSKISLHVLPATEANLADFSRDDLRELRDACNGDPELRPTVEELLRRKGQ